MEGEKSITKIVEEKTNTEDPIHEVEKRPAIWEPSTEDYSNKTERRNAWNDIILHFIPDFEGKSPAPPPANDVSLKLHPTTRGATCINITITEGAVIELIYILGPA
ncbi:hypothetical protein SK128_011960 [Halocaridina rubra]|uniref:MADF domain-containing protein n=1 Tax=Halocaridina rubra TaxID=373956 RepID=A0AAN8WZC8_HALRR